ncbi:MAG: hypothetical protein R6U98_03710, partial [Pirellulaceae bacterium]
GQATCVISFRVGPKSVGLDLQEYRGRGTASLYRSRMTLSAASPTNGRTGCAGPLSTRKNPTA